MLSISTTEDTPELCFYIMTTINTFNGNKEIEVVSSTDAKGMARIMTKMKDRPSRGYIRTSQVIELTLINADGQGDWSWMNADELFDYKNEEGHDDD